MHTSGREEAAAMHLVEPETASARPAASERPAIAWTVSPDVRADVTAAAPVLLDLRGGQCHALNALGGCIWRLLAEAEEGLTDAALAEALRPLVSGAPPDLESDVRAFRESLARKGLVRPAARSNVHGSSQADGARAIPAARVTAPPLLRRVRWTPVQFAAAYTLLIASDVVMRIAGVRGLRALASRVRVPAPAPAESAPRGPEPRGPAPAGPASAGPAPGGPAPGDPGPAGSASAESASTDRASAGCASADSAQDVESAQALARTMARAAAWYYKHAWCLHRTVATSCFLRLHGIASTVCIGFHAVPFYGHAWVEVQDTVIDDRPSVRSRYRIVERF